MKLKSFYAKSMAEAMKQVRATLGEDAIIVNSHEEKSGMVKITAAIDDDEIQLQTAETKHAAKAAKSFSDDEIMEIITGAMLKHRVPSTVSEKIIATAMTIPGDNPKGVLADSLQKIFTFKKPLPATSPKRTILVGPPGAGKTLMAAKLATEMVMHNKKPVVITTDIARAGGFEQLSAFLKILKLPLQKAENAHELKALLKDTDETSSIIVDTGGLNPFDPQEMKFLAKLINTGDFLPALVLAAGTDAEESAEIAMTFAVLGIKQLIPTRLDFTRHLGGIFSAADRASLFFTEASNTPNVANGILYLNSEIMADLLIPNSIQKGKIKP